MTGRRSPYSIRLLMLCVAFVAGSMGWSAHWSECKYRAVYHETLANAERQTKPGTSLEERTRKQQNAQWHEEMRRRFERSAWLPWPGDTAEAPRP